MIDERDRSIDEGQHDTAETDAPDGQFHDQEMPTTDGELSDLDPDEGLADRQS